MKTKADSPGDALKLTSLPAFAQFLLTNRLSDFAEVHEQVMAEVGSSVYDALIKLSETECHAAILRHVHEFLNCLSENEPGKLIDTYVERWMSNQISYVDKYAVQVEDISHTSFIRKKTLLHFLPEYCTDPTKMIQIVEDVDLFLMHLDKAYTTTFATLLVEKLEANNHLIRQVNKLLPGAVYIYDINEFRTLYANDNLKKVFGYTLEELNVLRDEVLHLLIHADDQPVMRQHMADMIEAEDGAILSYKFRIRTKEGGYKWIRNYDSVFRRDADGKVIQVISIALDIDKEKRVSEQLRLHEAQLVEAQEIAQMGNFSWNMNNNGSMFSTEALRILELDGNDPDKFLARIHADDRQRVEEAIALFPGTGVIDQTFRYNGKAGEKTLWVRGKSVIQEDGSMSMHGTVIDLTDRIQLQNKALENERLYRGAERLANMGSWQWDLQKKELTWTDQLYRIYGLEPQSEKMTFDRFLSFVHPGDKPRIQAIIDSGFAEQRYEYTFCIVCPDGTEKTLQSTVQAFRNKKDKLLTVVGTEQDITEKQKLVSKLQESDQLYKQAQLMSHIGNWAIDIKKRTIHWSEELYRIYEVDPDTVIDEDLWFSFVHPEDLKEIRTYHKQCYEQLCPYDKTHRIVLKSGKVKVVHRRGEFIFDKQGNAVRMVGTTQDVTEQYRAQQNLADRENFIRKITNATPSIIASFNVNTGKYVFVSEGLEKMLGYDVATALERGASFFEGIIHPDDLEGVQLETKKAMEAANQDRNSEPVLKLSYRMQHRNGNYRWFDTYGTIFDRNSEGRVEHLLYITLDVTSQMDAAKKISEQEYFIQQIADASPTILYLFDVKSGRFVYINREVFYVLGYTPEELLNLSGESLYDLYHDDDRDLLPERQGSSSHFQYQESMMQYECRMRNKMGAWCWFLNREIVFKKNEAGEVEQILGAALDINKRKEMERTLLQNSFQLEQSNSSLEEFAYVASHDLKEPLRKISTFGDRLVSTQLDRMTDEGKIYLKKVVDASQRMQLMIDDLLAVSMITGNRQFQVYSLQQVLEDARQAVEYKIEQKGAVIEAPPLPEANIIPSQFRQLFQNLLSNSLKFAREGVKPVIRIDYAYLKPEDVEHLQLPRAAGYLQLRFSDNGIGFENEFSGKIFQIFQRLHGRSEYEGTGIGLAICKKIVEHHGGVIFANGQLDEGATFTIILPR